MENEDDRVTENEGVRLIGADEAAEALEREDVAHRRRDDEPRFGDRPPKPAADDQRPSIRFPLSADDPLGSTGERRPAPLPRASDDTAMPHWTEPPTGEVPRIFAAEDIEESPSWSGFASGQPRWRGEGSERHEDEYDDFSRLADDETRAGAMASDDRPHPEDFFSFDDDETFEEAATDAPDDRWSDEDGEVDDAYVASLGRAATRTISSDPRRAAPRNVDGGTGGAGRDVPVAVGVALAFGAIALIAFAAGPTITVVLIAGVLGVSAIELFNVLRQAGYQPAILLGVAACVALPLAAYYKGEVAIPAVLFLTVVFGLLWYLVGAGGEDRPVIGFSSTLFGIGWIGVLGSFAALMLVLGTTKDGVGSPGIGILLVAILGTVGYDVVGLAVGRNAGTRPLSPASPNKTVEGLIGGILGALIVGALASSMIAPFSDADFTAKLLVGLGIAIAAPLGDLCESLVKRDLDVKDMGTILPGHGGFLDRFDGMLFVLPVVYYLALILLY